MIPATSAAAPRVTVREVLIAVIPWLMLWALLVTGLLALLLSYQQQPFVLVSTP